MSDELKEQADMEEGELRKLALEIIEGTVFGTWNVPEHDTGLIGCVFMPLAFGLELPPNVAQVYEYISKAESRGVNGYPSFFSCRLMTENDAKRLYPMLQELRESRQSFLNSGS